MKPVEPGNILNHELIGLQAQVVSDSNPTNISLSGRVVDESRNTLVIEVREKPVRIGKKDAVFRFHLPSGIVEVEGYAIIGRPQDRIKRRLKRRW